MKSKKVSDLSKSILLEESGSPALERAIIIITILIIGVFIFWAANMKLAEIAIAKGEVVPSQKLKQVQHHTGGIIKKILVDEGGLVEKGQVIIELDKTIMNAKINQTLEKIKMIKRQKRVWHEKYQIRRKLVTIQLNTKMAYLNLKSEKNELDGEEAQSKELLKELREKLKLLDIKSPITGYVHGLKAHTIGGVISPGSVIMEIVPRDRELVAFVKVLSKDIGHVEIGMPVTLKFDTYDFGRYGGIIANLDDISHTTFYDALGNPYFQGTIKLPKDHLGVKQGFYPIGAGMTLQAEIKTNEKTVMEYLLKPIYASANQALIER